jgi:feruloyl esterase
MNALTQSAIDACDELDGVKDGIIAMEGLCSFDPLTVVGKTVNCTSPNGTIKISKKAAQIAAAIWAGAKASDGSALWYGLPYGSPLIYLGGTNCTSLTDCETLPFSISADWMQLFLQRNTSFDVSTIGFEQFDSLFRQSVNEYASAIGTRDPDLTRFKEAGGKMITWHGMKDQLIFFNGTEHYYRQVLERDPKAHDFYRFFPAPGVEHCSAGSGWYPGESMKALIDWVEHGVAPETLKAVATPSATGGAQPPLRTAGLCPWPKVMTFVGGNPDKASSFVCK